ncbi:MAG: hypothetical protein H6817_08835 [Phycisphaerales bacterium]|nr:hypothetical protein [Phycisphaerales bacterium]
MADLDNLLQDLKRLSEKEDELHRAYFAKITELSENRKGDIQGIKDAYKKLDAIQREILACLQKLR